MGYDEEALIAFSFAIFMVWYAAKIRPQFNGFPFAKSIFSVNDLTLITIYLHISSSFALHLYWTALLALKFRMLLLERIQWWWWSMVQKSFLAFIIFHGTTHDVQKKLQKSYCQLYSACRFNSISSNQLGMWQYVFIRSAYETIRLPNNCLESVNDGYAWNRFIRSSSR